LTDEGNFILDSGIDEEIALRNELPKLAKKLNFVTRLKLGLGKTMAVVDSQLDYCDLGSGSRQELIARLHCLHVDENV
jgi:hypothetical protein